MRRITGWLVLGLLGLTAAPTMSQTDAESRSGRSGRAADEQERGGEELLGFWPTPKMVDGMVYHVARELARHYEFDEDQTEQMTSVIRERFVSWFQKNRRQIQPLVNEFMESQLASEAPLSENVAKWAGRVVPLVEDFHTVMEGATDEMRGFMTDDQQAQLEADMAAYNVARRLALDKVYRWKEGGFDPESEWTADPGERRRREREEQRAAKAAIETERERVEAELGVSGERARREVVVAHETPRAGESAPAGAKPEIKDEWARYVEDFVKRYALDQGQQGQAQRALARRQESRADYLRRKADELDRTQRLISSAETPEDKARALDELAALNKPLERIFQQLKDDLEKIPTRKQRSKAAETELRKSKNDAPGPRVAEAAQPPGGRE